jgi:hypothetical protein
MFLLFQEASATAVPGPLSPFSSCFFLLKPQSGNTELVMVLHPTFFSRVQGLSNQRIGPENAILKGLQTGPLPRPPSSSPLQNFFPTARQQLLFQNGVLSLQRKKTLAAWTGAPALTGRSSGGGGRRSTAIFTMNAHPNGWRRHPPTELASFIISYLFSVCFLLLGA